MSTPAASRAAYRRRIEAVMDYVMSAPDRNHSLAELAAVACLSPFHFHRVFRALTGEAVGETVNRLRLERAAAALVYDRRRSVTAVAMDLGYSSSANFTRAFTRHFGCPPSHYRTAHDRGELSKIGKARVAAMVDHAPMSPAVTIVDRPARRLARLRSVGPYRHEVIADLFGQLERWASNLGLPAAGREHLGITWSDSMIVDSDHWRYDACITVEAHVTSSGAVAVDDLPGGTTACLTMAGPGGSDASLQFGWDALVGAWLPESGWQPDDRTSYEVYRPRTGGGFDVDLCLPIRPL